jgi:hypothetical protein
MDFIFLGGFFPKNVYEEIIGKSKRQVQHSANKFQWAFIEGLEKNVQKSLKLITAPFIGWYPLYYKDLFISTSAFPHPEDWKQRRMVGFFNLPVVKNVFKYFNLKKHIHELISSNADTVIIVYSLDIAYLKSALDAKKENPRLKVCVIIPDLHEFPGDSSILYKLYLKYFEKPSFYRLLNRIDCFIVLSDQMVEYLKIENKPWIRIEGLYNSTGKFLKKNYKAGSVKSILYTGTLDFKYGIKDLLDAFELIKSNDYELWICGGGVGADLVKQKAYIDKRIRYFGIVSEAQVSRLQLEATILINPRNNEGEFNRYSFPSKTMEYFASGTPTLMHRLEGVPKEYYEYCYIFENNDIQSMASTINFVCELSPDVLMEKGVNAQEFIFKNKDSIIQCAKVVEMLEGLSF